MLQVPLIAEPTQTLVIVLNGQSAQIELRQNGQNLYFSLTVNDSPIVLTRICRDRQRLLLDAEYRGFAGDFAFVDLQGYDQPHYLGLGTRWALVYFEAGER